MKFYNKTLVGLIILFAVSIETQAQSKNISQAHATYMSLDGQVLKKGNILTEKGNIQKISIALLRLVRTKSKLVKGTFLLMPGGDYQTIRLKNEGQKISSFLNNQGFDVAILDYHVGLDIKNRDIALGDAIKAFRLLRKSRLDFNLRGERLDIMGLSAGGHLAAKTVQKLAATEQPNNLMLIAPSFLDETVTGTVNPAVIPPVKPTASLFTTISDSDKKSFVDRCKEYTKTWIGYDGSAIFTELPDGALISSRDADPMGTESSLPDIIKNFLNAPKKAKDTTYNPAAVPVEGYNRSRHKEKLTLLAKEKFDLMMIGNSITNNFEKPEYQTIWKQFFAPRNAINLGFSAYRTENLIWNLQNGQLEGQSPKVVVLEIGTNNIDEKNYPTRHTASELAGGITAIVKILREKLPTTKIIIMRCFPGCYGGPNPTSHRAILERASDLVSHLADGKNIFFCDVNYSFLNLDGTINHAQMPDWLHPSPAGAKSWAQAMEPLLSQLMGDKSLDTNIPSNNAVIPVPKLENDGYDWYARHNEVLKIKDACNPEIILIGNSISHFWGGNQPVLRNEAGDPQKTSNGPKSWESVFGKYSVLNLGFGWDRTQNVLWRLDHGEIDGLHPKMVIIDIGTNNITQTQNARSNTASEIVDGISTIIARVRSKIPETKIVLMAIFPRDADPLSPKRQMVYETNRLLKIFAKENNITIIDIGEGFLAPDRHFLPGMMRDYVHPTDKGYQIWADRIRDIVEIP